MSIASPNPSNEPAPPQAPRADNDQTPYEYAKILVGFADVAGQYCLEPNFGRGNIVRAMFAGGANGVTAIDKYADNCSELGADVADKVPPTSFNMYCTDFLDLSLRDGDFDRIVMVPPFMDPFPHLLKAKRLLSRGGTLVAVIDVRATAAEEFREFTRFNAFRSEVVPDGMYRVDGHNIQAVAIIVSRAT